MTNHQNILRQSMEVLGREISTSIIQQIILSEQYDNLSEQLKISKKNLLKHKLLNQDLEKEKNRIQDLEKEKRRLETEMKMEEERCDQVLRKEYRRKKHQLQEV
jgi:hypothetical protein